MLEGKVAVVTGASRGIGRAISLIYAEHGCNLVLNYNRSEDAALRLKSEIEKTGVEVEVCQGNVQDRTQVKELFKQTKKRFGQLDVLVNNAGVLHDNLAMMTPEQDYDDIMAVNLKGTFNCIQYAAKMMMHKNCGKIINLSSVVGRYGNSGQVAYAGSKAGVIGITTAAAKELGAFGITVNAIAPGVIQTDMIASLTDEKRDSLVENTALKRIGKPHDVARVALFLASNLSDYVSGQVIGVDGCQII